MIFVIFGTSNMNLVERMPVGFASRNCDDNLMVSKSQYNTVLG